MSLAAEEFLRRFVQHVLPRGFVKVRHYGLLANRHREGRLDACRRLLLVANAAAGVADVGRDPDGGTVAPAPQACCPHCGGRRLTTIHVPKGERQSWDTS